MFGSIIFFDRYRINTVCTMLKYMFLTQPLQRIDILKNSVKCNVAGTILNTILMNSEWMLKNDGNKNNPFVSGLIKCKFNHDWNKMFDVLCIAYSVLNEKGNISLYSSNYTGGYYGEVYQICSNKDYTKKRKISWVFSGGRKKA